MHKTVLLTLLALTIAGCGGGETTAELERLPTPVNEPTVIASSRDPAESAADALGRIGAPAVPALAEALSDPDPLVRIRACRALASMGIAARDAVSPLIRTLSDNVPAVREEAARALGQIGEPAEPAVPTLIQMMREKS